MASIDSKVDMSLDDIIKMNKQSAKRGGRGRGRGRGRGQGMGRASLGGGFSKVKQFRGRIGNTQVRKSTVNGISPLNRQTQSNSYRGKIQVRRNQKNRIAAAVSKKQLARLQATQDNRPQVSANNIRRQKWQRANQQNKFRGIQLDQMRTFRYFNQGTNFQRKNVPYVRQNQQKSSQFVRGKVFYKNTNAINAQRAPMKQTWQGYSNQRSNQYQSGFRGNSSAKQIHRNGNQRLLFKKRGWKSQQLLAAKQGTRLSLVNRFRSVKANAFGVTNYQPVNQYELQSAMAGSSYQYARKGSRPWRGLRGGTLATATAAIGRKKLNRGLVALQSDVQLLQRQLLHQQELLDAQRSQNAQLLHQQKQLLTKRRWGRGRGRGLGNSNPSFKSNSSGDMTISVKNTHLNDSVDVTLADSETDLSYLASPFTNSSNILLPSELQEEAAIAFEDAGDDYEMMPVSSPFVGARQGRVRGRGRPLKREVIL